MSNVKERPITLTAEEVQAIRGRGKSQMRRPIEPQPVHQDGGYYWPNRESFQIAWAAEDSALSTILPGYKSEIPTEWFLERNLCPYSKPGGRLSVPGEPGLTLEITELRAEHLQDISEEDAEKEGADCCCDGCGEVFDIEKNALGYCWRPECAGGSFSYRAGFRNLWDSIYGKKHPWESNPWVWVIGFKKIEEKTE